MKTYKVYNTAHFDKNTGVTSDSVFLTEKCRNDYISEFSDTWTSFSDDWSIDEIVKYVYSKEDVDIFVEENPETAIKTFSIWNKNYNKNSRDYFIQYIPIEEIRDYKIGEILK